MPSRILLISLQGNSGSDRYYELLNEALNRFSALESDLIFLPSQLELLPFLIPHYLKKLNLDRYNIIHTNSEHGHFFRATGKVVVNTIHHNVFETHYKKYTSIPQKIFHQFWIKPNLKKSLKMADLTIAVSHHTRHSIINTFSIDPAAVHVVYNGIDTQRFKHTEMDKKNIDKTRLLFVGNTSRRKGFDLMQPIMEKLGPQYELYFTTGLRDKKAIKKGYALAKNMVPLQKISTEQLVEEYNRSDALLFPSRLEGFGYCIAEALCCGTPVVTTNYSAMPELIRDGHNGFLCSLDDIDDFVNKIKMCRQLKSRDIAEQARERFDLCFYAREMELLYRKIWTAVKKTNI